MAYKKQLYVYNGERNLKAVIRNYTEADFQPLIEVQKASFPPPFPSELWWNEEQLLNHVTLFPDGALCVEVEGKIVGSVTGLLVHMGANPNLHHTWEEITDDGYIRTHDLNGDTLYVVDICVHPDFRKLDLGRLLMQSMYEVVVHYQLERLLGGGRLPGYHKKADKLSAEEYLNGVVAGRWKDPVTTFLLRCGRTPIGVIENYLEDEESLHYAALMEWKNPFKR